MEKLGVVARSVLMQVALRLIFASRTLFALLLIQLLAKEFVRYTGKLSPRGLPTNILNK